MAKSTFCRKCSEYFAITPSLLAGAGPIVATGSSAAPSAVKPSPAGSSDAPGYVAREPLRPVTTPPPAAAGGGGLRDMLGGFLSSKPKTRTAHCFECTSWHEISSSAQSTTCKACGAYIDLQDYKINGSFSRNIKTRGTLYLGSKGDLSSSKIICEHATIHGKMRGNLSCAGKVTIRVQGRLYGSLEAGQLIVEKGSEVIFSRPVRASSVEIHGAVSGGIMSDSFVTIFKTGSLDGPVDATGFTVEKGGVFQGELTIRPRVAADAAGAEGGQPAAEKVQPDAGENPGLLGGEQQPAMG